MTNPYLVGDQRSLRPSLLCFLDILGYREMVAAADTPETAAALFGRLHEALREGSDILTGADIDAWFDALDENGNPTTAVATRPDDHAITAFTDNIVIAWPIWDDGEQEWGTAVRRLARFQLSMVRAGFFVRGAIAFGPAYVDHLSVFGPALLEAYNGESSLAVDPRIILTESARNLVATHMGYYFNVGTPQEVDLLRDRDGQWFVSYLEELIFDEEMGGVAWEEVTRHRDTITEKLQLHAADPRIWSKYEWVARYHNHFCSSHPTLFDETHQVAVDALRAGFRGIASTTGE